MLCPRCGRAVAGFEARCPTCRTPLGVADDARTLGVTQLSFSSARSELDAPTLLPGLAVVSDTVAAGGNGEDVEIGPLVPGRPFGARYHIIRLLGIGGMGAVYQAWDAELAVAVAIKVIRPEVMADPEAAAEVERRFKRELLLAREVTHKNVVRIHDLGEIDGIKYITMSYVDGTDLATILARDGALPVAAALKIARQVVDGLLAAHAASIVHRDLKPANIMISRQGDALIMDFGIAHSTGGAIGGSGSALSIGYLPASLARVARPQATMQGSIVGTLQYMAPEQARGLPVDQRADIYAFGLIVYDMLAGSRRVDASESAFAELQARMDGAPLPVRSITPDIPAAVDAIVSRCVEPDADKRYQTTGELAAALDRLDANGNLIPIRRVVGMRGAAAVAALLVALSVGTWWFTPRSTAPVAHDPVSVVIADFQNRTGDPAFDRTLEPMLKRALEGAGFISAFDRNAISRTLGVAPPATLDDKAARELAVKQGLGVVLSGSIDRQGNGYGVGLKAIQTVTGNEVASATGRAANKGDVVSVATRLVTTVRKALGDKMSDSAQIFAMTTLSASSLDVVRLYAAAQDASSNSKFDEARRDLISAVTLDPKFGVGYQLLAVASMNLGNRQDAQKYISEALKHLDGMTERERFSTRGQFYRITGDYPACVKEYGDLLTRYAGDPVAHNQLALCSSQLRNLRRAQDEMREVVKILPKRVLFRDNLALYSSYASDFPGAEREARAIQEPDPYSILSLAFAQLGQGRVADTIQTYRRLESTNALGTSLAASGLGDVAMYEGRFLDAIAILGAGAAADAVAHNTDRAAAKFAALAHAYVSKGQTRLALTAAANALMNGNAVKIRFLAARTFIEAGAIPRARPLIASLASELQAEPQAYAKIADGEIALATGDNRQAIKLFGEANALLDTWIGHFDLGRAYLSASQFAQADSEFDRCIKRRGEAMALFLDEEPTYGYFPSVYYYQGQVRAGLQNAGFAESYRQYLAIRGASKEDPLLAEVRRRSTAN